jgi:uncharacterized cupredoxin-like copper-binding protein
MSHASPRAPAGFSRPAGAQSTTDRWGELDESPRRRRERESQVKRALTFLALTLSAAAVVTPLATPAPARSNTTTVSVSGREFLFTLSRKSGVHGTFVFRFKNVGHLPHDFKIAGRKTPLIQPGRSAILTIKIVRPGRYPYLCTVPGHAAAGMKGVFIVR